VLDSWAYFAFAADEPAADRVDGLLADAREGRLALAMCTVNVGEVLYYAERRGGSGAAAKALDALLELPIELVPASLELTVQAAALKADTPVAFADCFAAALAQLRDAEVATGDPEFRKFPSRVKVLWLTDE